MFSFSMNIFCSISEQHGKSHRIFEGQNVRRMAENLQPWQVYWNNVGQNQNSKYAQCFRKKKIWKKNIRGNQHFIKAMSVLLKFVYNWTVCVAQYKFAFENNWTIFLTWLRVLTLTFNFNLDTKHYIFNSMIRSPCFDWWKKQTNK